MSERDFLGQRIYNGRVVQHLPCRRIDPRLTETFPNGRSIEYNPMIIYSDHPEDNPCTLTGNCIPSTTVVTSVPKVVCDAQQELGMCPLEALLI